MKLTFIGATNEVTGSLTYIETNESRFIIDCGLTQGEEERKSHNTMKGLPFKASDLDGIFVTHAHLDHTGLIPKLIKDGFRGKIYCTQQTSKLMNIILMDSAKLNKESNLYDTKDVSVAISLLSITDWNIPHIFKDIQFTYLPSGHILGASSIQIQYQNKTTLFSGDLGRRDDPILLPYQNAPDSDFVIMESTYGNRIRKSKIDAEIEKFVQKISNESRIGIIASFAVSRGQTLITLLYKYMEENPQYKVRIVMDSPMMKASNVVYKKNANLTLMPETLFSALESIDAIEHEKEWLSLKQKDGPLIIVASSGMVNGGRISRHLMNWKDDARAILLLAGYQGAGTPGRALLEGNRTLQGPDEEIFKWMGEIWHSDAFSSHADKNELIEWVVPSYAKKVMLIHGQTESKEELKKDILSKMSTEVIIPKLNETIIL